MNKTDPRLMAENAALQARVLELEAANAALQQDSHDLAERVKELRTLYRISALADSLDSSLDEYLQELVVILPDGWLYAADACARVIYRKQVFATLDFEETLWQQHSQIEVRGERVGTLTVGYRSPHPERRDGPFLAEERSLIDEIAKRIGRFIERKQADEAQQQLAAIVESSDDAIFSETLDGMVMSWNVGAEHVYGYPADEIVGRHISYDFDSPTKRPTF